MTPYLDLHTHQAKTSEDVVAIQSLAVSEALFLAMPKIKPISVGIHPWFSEEQDFAKNMKYLNVLARQQNVKLIGECGLDKLKGAPLKFQVEALAAQIELGCALNKPVVLHCVKAFDELIALKKKLKPAVPLIVHGFNKSEALANQLIQNGFYLSFGAAVLKSTAVKEIISKISIPFFLETDDATVSIQEIYQEVSDLKKIAVNELKDIIFAHWKILGLQ